MLLEKSPDLKDLPALSFHDRLKQHLVAHFSNAVITPKTVNEKSSAEQRFLGEVNSTILRHIDDEQFDMFALSRKMLLSRSQLYRRLKPLIRQSPAQYLKYVRLIKAKELLELTDMQVGEAAFKTGFASQSHFTRSFQQEFGMSPSEYRRSLTKCAN